MARLIAFGADNGTRDLDALDSVDLEALALARRWGVQNGHKERQWTYSPARARTCGGAIVDGFGGACLLCAQPFGQEPVKL